MMRFVIGSAYDGIGPCPQWITRWLSDNPELRRQLEIEWKIARELKSGSGHWMQSMAGQFAPPQFEDLTQAESHDRTSPYQWLNIGLSTALVIVVSFFLFKEVANDGGVTLSVADPLQPSQVTKAKVKASSIVAPAGIFGFPSRSIAMVNNISTSLGQNYLMEAESQFNQASRSIAEMPMRLFPEEIVNSTRRILNSSVN